MYAGVAVVAERNQRGEIVPSEYARPVVAMMDLGRFARTCGALMICEL
jgi:hypothetical protein